MKKTIMLILLGLLGVFVVLPCHSAQAQTANLQETLKQYVADLQDTESSSA